MKKQIPVLFLFFLLITTLHSCTSRTPIVTAPQWQEVTLSFTSEAEYLNPYMEVDLTVDFTHDNGEVIVRPAFWDGENIWKVSFASPVAEGTWSFETTCSNAADKRLHGITGYVRCTPYEGSNPLISNGLLRMSPGKRNVVHAGGQPFLLVGDTPWALPFRGTTESVLTYAQDRQSKGYNAALLMSLQPDRGAEGPRDRSSVGGFGVAFEDLKDGHITEMNISYFQHLDSLVNLLIDHGIVPVYQPVFHGFGWKGKNLLGWDMVPEEYARYCRYLVSRYGAKPAMWLVGGDGNGMNPGVREGGEDIEKWDAYRQPTGIHYNPFDDYCPGHSPVPCRLILTVYRWFASILAEDILSTAKM